MGGVFGSGVFDEVVNEPEHIGVLADVVERVITVGMAGVYQVEHPQGVPPLQEQRPGSPQNFPLGVGDDVAGVGQEDVGLHQKPGLAGAGAAHHDLQQVAPVLFAV